MLHRVVLKIKMIVCPQEDKVENKTEFHEELQIFVNRRRFGRSDGVKDVMTGAEIAALVDVPPENAIIRIDDGHEKPEIRVDQKVEIRNGQHFLVTRKRVEGGCVS
jgi:hypothetical protein